MAIKAYSHHSLLFLRYVTNSPGVEKNFLVPTSS